MADLVPVCNFYSTGEDVLQNPTSDTSHVLGDMLSNWDTARGAWGHQEMIKGSTLEDLSLGSVVFVRVQGGWNTDGSRQSDMAVGDEDLKTNPFFVKFLEGGIFNPDSAVAAYTALEMKVQYDVLARGIPALSFTAGANPIPALDEEEVGLTRNINMQTKGHAPGVWPTEGHAGFRAGNWLHSDFKNVALPYVSELYQTIVGKGSLETLQ